MHWPVLRLLLAVAYPLSLHVAILAERRSLALLILCITASIHTLILFLRDVRGFERMLFPAIAALAMLAWWFDDIRALYLPPILISGGIFALFASTLRAGHEPLVTRFERLLEGRNDPATNRYTRRVTQVWSAFLGAMLAECLILPLVAPLETWSLFTNVLNYVFIATLFVLELALRTLLFRRLPRLAGLRHLLAGNAIGGPRS